MPNSIRQLVEAHEFLRSALQTYGSKMAPIEAARLKRECDAQFLKILRYRSTEPIVTLAQVKFMLESLERLSKDAEAAHELVSTCIDAVTRLASPATAAAKSDRRPPSPQNEAGASPAPESAKFALLDSTSDRVAIIDRNYKYVFANRANAEFHSMPRSAMIGSPLWSVIGQGCFRNLSKPRLDECFKGKRISFCVRHTWREPSVTCSVLFEPLFDADGKIVSVLGTVRDVTGLNLADAEVSRMPDN